MSRPLLLDLFCGAGGAGQGYRRAGFDVLGVDINPQPDYPGDFIQADALAILQRRADNPRRWAPSPLFHNVAAIHASPPCQASCTLTKGTNQGREYRQMIPAVRDLLARIGLPCVIENVQGSDLRRDLTLCGEMFDLGVIRHRYFEVSVPVQPIAHRPHRGRVAGWRHGEWHDGPYFAVYGQGGGKGSIEQWQQAMGIDWTRDRRSLAEAIPPAYTQFIGEQLMEFLTDRE